jgi:hypothetical protein
MVGWGTVHHCGLHEFWKIFQRTQQDARFLVHPQIVTEWPKLHSLDGDRSAKLGAMTARTIPEYLEEEREKAAVNQLRIEEEAARIQPLQHGHHRTAKQPKLELIPPLKAATKKKKKRKTVALAQKKPRATRKTATKTLKRA